MTETQIANRALSLLGEPSIASLDDGTAVSRVIGLHYEQVRDALLQSHPWDFVIARADLSRASSGPVFGWSNSYPLPSDCLRVLSFNGQDVTQSLGTFAIESGNLNTEAQEVSIVYVRRSQNLAGADPLFLEVLAYRLASAICMEVTGDATRRDELEKLANERMSDARFIDANQGIPRVVSPLAGSSGMGARCRSGYFGDDSIHVVTGPPGPQGERGLQGDQGIQGIQGNTGAAGADGNDGWTPVLAIVSDGARRVQQVVDWTGGEGTKPGTGQYVGVTGLVSAIGDGVDIRGATGPQGSQGIQGETGPPGPTGSTGTAGQDGVDGVVGLRFTRDTNSTAPGTGDFTVNNDTVSSITTLRIRKMDADGQIASVWLATLAANDSIYISSSISAAWFLISSVTVNADDYQFGISSAGGSLQGVGELHGIVAAERGPTGAQGVAGTNGTNGADGVSAGIPYNFSTSTANTDPGAGYLRFDNASPSFTTEIRINEDDANANFAGNWVITWDASTNTNKGILTISRKSTPSVFVAYYVSGNVYNSGAFYNVPVSHIWSHGSFSNNDDLIVSFSPSGDKADWGMRYIYDSSTTMSAPGSGNLRFNNTQDRMAISLTDATGWDRAGEFSYLTDSTSSVKGQIRIQKVDSQTDNSVVYNVTGEATGGAGWDQLIIENVTDNSVFSNGDYVIVTFTRAGDKGEAGADGSGILTGMVMPYAGSTLPSGWLWCDGSSVSRTTYADLFTAIGTTYGSVDGASFNLPDLRGRVIAGVDNMNNSVGTGGGDAARLTATTVDGDTLGNSGGTETHTLSIAEMPAHTHSVPTTDGTANRQAGASNTPVNTDGTSGSTGGGGAHNNVQPTLVLNYMIKT